MPKKDGVEACLEIKESLRDTRVTMLNASTEAIAEIGALAHGIAPVYSGHSAYTYMADRYNDGVVCE